MPQRGSLGRGPGRHRPPPRPPPAANSSVRRRGMGPAPPASAVAERRPRPRPRGRPSRRGSFRGSLRPILPGGLDLLSTPAALPAVSPSAGRDHTPPAVPASSSDADNLRRREIWLGKRPMGESSPELGAVDNSFHRPDAAGAHSSPADVFRNGELRDILLSSFVSDGSLSLPPTASFMDVSQSSPSEYNHMPWVPWPVSSLSAIDPPVMQSSGGRNSGTAGSALPQEDVLPTPAVGPNPLPLVSAVPSPSPQRSSASRRRRLVLHQFKALSRTRMSAGFPGRSSVRKPSVQRRRRKRVRQMAARHPLAFLQAVAPADLQLPLPVNLVKFLKATWPGRSSYGGPHLRCKFCGASYWFQERNKSLSTDSNPVYTGCCRGGRVSLPVYPDWPPPLSDLMRFDGGADSTQFMRLIRQYNSMFAFTSLGVNVDRSVNIGKGPYIFKICGVACHEIGSLLPPEDNRVPKFAQLYIYDTENELNNRMDIFRQDVAQDVEDELSDHSQDIGQSSVPTVGRRRRRGGATTQSLGNSLASPVRRQRRRTEEPDPAVVKSLTTMLNGCNSLVQTFRMAKDRLLSPECPELAIRLYGHEGVDHGNRYSLPAAPELAALIVDDFSVEACRFDIIVEKEAGYFQRVTPLNPSLMAMQYPLLFPHASLGFHLGITYQQVDSASSTTRTTVSMLQYYCYRFHYRSGEPNPFTCCGRLSQQILVDAFSCVESCRLSYHYWNQTTLRSETYQGISDALGEGNSRGKNVGVEYILHTSFTGGPRYMIQYYHDGMAICRVYGAPDLFVTFTCNPKWDEITEALLTEPGQTHVDRPDIVTRVFKMKITEFAHDVTEGTTFGDIHAYLYVVEFQKRGLPHIHCLVWLKADTDDPTPSKINSYISAEIPDYQDDPLGYALVEEFMVHGPCGEHNPEAPCMKDGSCSKRFPKDFNEETTIDGLGFPVYRRRNNGRYVVRNGIRLDNRWIVPYNMALLKKFQAHINVEWCNKTNLLKYLFKYLAKGHDMARARLHSMFQSANPGSKGRNEIDEYTKCRYLSACEACWRMFASDIHVRAPSVHRLVVHLERMNRVIFSQHDELEDVIRDSSRHKTMLTEWFVANQRYEDARALTYLEFPSKWRWDASKKKWFRRKRDLQFGPRIGRVYNVHPSCGELFYLRMLLTVVAGARNFNDLRVYNGTLHASFKAACQARGLVGDDNEWFLLFDEAIQWASSYQLRHLFMTVLLFCNVTNGQRLLDKYWHSMADDLALRLSRSSHVASQNSTASPVPPEYLYVHLLNELSVMFGRNGYSLSSFGISTDLNIPGSLVGNRLIMEELQYDTDELRTLASSLHAKLNEDQLLIYGQIISAAVNGTGGVFFVSGHGGTGKTFLWSSIITRLRADDHIVLAVASSGVASLLLPGGRTAHSCFRIPIELNERTMCTISRGSNLAGLIEKATLILWDEAPMTHRRCFEAVDRSMRDVLSMDDPSRKLLPFGGKTVVLGGDFRQVLPVVEGGSRTEIINSSLLKSPLWQHVTVLRLRQNMRLSNPSLSTEERATLEEFAQWVLAVGNGTVPLHTQNEEVSPSWLFLPKDVSLLPESDPLSSIVDTVYDSFLELHTQSAYLAERAIVCPTNKVADTINEAVFSKVPGEEVVFESCDSICKTLDHAADADLLYTPEFLHKIDAPNFPQHRITLKVGVPIMLLRNINQAIGLCNGTRLMVTRLGEWVLEAKIMTGTNVGDCVCIPRIILHSPASKWPFTLERRQYPIRLCYAMTINKSQGQTLKKVGVYLPKPVFTHGQFYVAISRVTSKEGLKILALDEDGLPTSETRNIVYQEVLEYL